MSRGLHARDHQVYVKRESDPQLGAKRYIKITHELGDFYNRIEDVIEEVAENNGITEIHNGKRLGGVRLYDNFDPESNQRPTLKLFEKRLVTEFGRRQRIGWDMRDLGLTQERIRNSIARLEKPDGYKPDGSIEVTFSEVIRPASGETGGKRKFAMIAEQSSDAAAYLVEEHIAVFEGLKEGLKGKSNSKKEFTFPYGDFDPQVTLGIFDENVAGRIRNSIIEDLGNKVLPFTCTLEPLYLYTNQEVLLGPDQDFDTY